MTDIYEILEDGRIIELKLGRQANREQAIWGRRLSTNEKEIYLQLKNLGYSDLRIYKQLNGEATTLNATFAILTD